MNFDEVASTSAVALSFTESPLYINPLTSDDSADQSANMSYDGVLEVHAPIDVGLYTMPSVHLRGGFRYLTVVSTSDGSVTISNISCAITFMPHVENLRNYTGYFYATDPSYIDQDFLTKVLHIAHESVRF